jgi:hypothetical protein
VIDDIDARDKISKVIASSLDELVIERMQGLIEEPDITSRIGQRLEDSFNGRVIAGYKLRVISETITSHGAKSLENPTGTDLYLGVAVEHSHEIGTSKGILIQAKRSLKTTSKGLVEQCRRMNLITKKGSIVWIYSDSGIKVLKAAKVVQGDMKAMTNSKFFDQVLKCSIGDKTKVPEGPFGDRQQLKVMLETLGAKNGVALKLRKH